VQPRASRSVNPEVAGSSPVEPAIKSQKRNAGLYNARVLPSQRLRHPVPKWCLAAADGLGTVGCWWRFVERAHRFPEVLGRQVRVARRHCGFSAHLLTETEVGMQKARGAAISVGLLLLLGIWPGPVRAADTVILTCRVGGPVPGPLEVSSCAPSAGVPVACPVTPPGPPPPPGFGAPCAQTLANFLTPPGFKLLDVHIVFDQIVYTIVNKHPVGD